MRSLSGGTQKRKDLQMSDAIGSLFGSANCRKRYLWRVLASIAFYLIEE